MGTNFGYSCRWFYKTPPYSKTCQISTTIEFSGHKGYIPKRNKKYRSSYKLNQQLLGECVEQMRS